jgi:hypothetical protein
MTTSAEVVSAIITELNRIDGQFSPFDRAYRFNYNLHRDVYMGFKFFDEISSFPSVYLTVEREDYFHYGANNRFIVLTMDLRGYTYDQEVEESGELLAQDIEHIMQYIKKQRPDIEEIRVLSVETDSGLNAPYGVALFKLEALYQR